MKRALRICCAAVLFAALLGGLPAEAVISPPETATYVNDYGNLLDANTLAELSSIGEALEKKTGAEVVLVTVESLDDMPIEQYALSLFRSWGLGKKDKNNGVLLLVDRERLLSGQNGKVRIEVGYGLEGAIPDGKAGYILDQYVLPEWQKQDYAAGIRLGYLALAAEVAAEYGVTLDGALAPLEEYRDQSTDGLDKRELIIILFLFLFFFIPFIFNFLRRGDPSSRRRFPTGGFGGFGGFGGGGFGGGGFGGGASGGGGASR